MRVCINKFSSLLERLCVYGTTVVRARNMFIKGFFQDPLVLSFLSETELSSATAKLAFFGLKMTTSVDCYGSLGSRQSVDREERMLLSTAAVFLFYVAFTYGCQGC